MRGKRQKKLNRREVELAAHLQVERVLESFLRRFARSRQRYDRVEAALAQVNEERLILQAEREGALLPGTRRLSGAPEGSGPSDPA